MSDATIHPPSASQYNATRMGWFSRTESWLDERGKGAWIAAMVLGFIFVWPVGLAICIYMIWSKRMFSRNCATTRHHNSRHFARTAFKSSGNTAFDAYKAETLRRLQDEQTSFESFLDRLREAKDKTEFDAFMNERSTRAAPEADASDDAAEEPAKS